MVKEYLNLACDSKLSNTSQTKTDLDAAHFFDEIRKLFVLREQELNIGLLDARTPCDAGDARLLHAKQLGRLRTVQF